MRLAGLLMGAAGLLLCAESAVACNIQWDFPDSCYAKDKNGNTIPGPGRSSGTESPTTATDAKVKGPVNDTTLMPAPEAPKIVPLRDLSKSIQTLEPPPQPKAATTSPPVYQRYPPGFTGVTGFNAPQATSSRVGGVSLSKAAAERMPLNISIDSSYVKDGRIVLSGQPNSLGSIDAAIFLTALRAACEDHDPYFSLDPDNIYEWQEATRQGVKDLLARIKPDLGWSIRKGTKRNARSILHFRTISARRDYPDVWQNIRKKYPALKSRLVFKPEWLRETRFGEILYKADVLLKELAGGTPSLDVANLRASKIPDYVSATQQNAAKSLLFKRHNIEDLDFTSTGGRIWYDFSESSSVSGSLPAKIPNVNSELNKLLLDRRFLHRPTELPAKPILVAKSENALDISDVYPRMFVRVRDPVSGKDTTGNFPGIDELALRANKTPQQYAATYKEYQALVEVFRAYTAAAHMSRGNSAVCRSIPYNLLPEEKVTTPMPAYHPADLALTVGWYEYTDGRFRRAIGVNSTLLQGGVSVGASAVLSRAVENATLTPVLREVREEAVKPPPETTWKSQSGRHFIAFALDEEVRPVRKVALAKGEDYRPAWLPSGQVVSPPPPAPLLLDVPTKVAQLAPQPANTNLVPDPYRSQKDLFHLAITLAIASLILLYRMSFGPQKTASRQTNIFAMPNLSSPDSVPYVPPYERDARYWQRYSVTVNAAPSPAKKTASGHDPVERDFKNVFAIKSEADRESMIRSWLSKNGGTRTAAMTSLVEQWRYDNRA